MFCNYNDVGIGPQDNWTVGVCSHPTPPHIFILLGETTDLAEIRQIKDCSKFDENMRHNFLLSNYYFQSYSKSHFEKKKV